MCMLIKDSILRVNNKKAYIPKNALYENTPITFKTIGDTIHIGEKTLHYIKTSH